MFNLPNWEREKKVWIADEVRCEVARVAEGLEHSRIQS